MTKELQNHDLENSVTSAYQKKKRKSVKNRILSRVIPLPGGRASAIDRFQGERSCDRLQPQPPVGTRSDRYPLSHKHNSFSADDLYSYPYY